MDTRVLYIAAVIIASITGGYYYYSGKGKKLDANTAQSMTYSANGINLLQTNDQGQLHVRATVDSLEQDMRDQTSKLSNLNASMYTANQVDSTFYAKQAHGYNDNEKVILTGNVKATRLTKQGEMVFLTDQLTGYPKLKTFDTKHKVTVNSSNGQFVSQGLQANLNNGQYEFFNIRGKYAQH
ncbi:LPS export ABC transporter periplasmic protein LptC [Acinetobacter sp. 187]|uniref:LPS export ABC transporter periplasmic protein LptC n=1 Tax=Acinetobacter lanii TaxID=2715163 RepID=UPI00140E1A77|nr:LPS export ABC transporter periplasmic protein LptC [Acinetobacter lanii]NHC03906.1 LPS export ABC transporter periplasmic protein LptC [Acinetobacter lanii]